VRVAVRESCSEWGLIRWDYVAITWQIQAKDILLFLDFSLFVNIYCEVLSWDELYAKEEPVKRDDAKRA
jgi:hypothetical protein